MVSVIIPVFQVSDYIERCICSVMGQSYSDIECIIVNDATEDDSIQKCEALIRDYEGSIQFQIIHHSSNLGLSAARNTGTSVATGDYLFYLDSDDEITPDCIGKLVTLAQSFPDVEMVLGNYQKHNMDGSVSMFMGQGIPSGYIGNIDFIPYFHQHLLSIAAWNKLMRRSFVLNNHLYFRDGIVCEDFLWMFYVIKALSKIYICKEVTYHYYSRQNSIINGKNDYIKGVSFSVIYDEILHNLTPSREKDELNCYVQGFCRCYLEHKEVIYRYRILFSLYRKKSIKYYCWLVYLKLCLTYLLGKSSSGLRIIHYLQSMRLRAINRISEFGAR